MCRPFTYYRSARIILPTVFYFCLSDNDRRISVEHSTQSSCSCEIETFWWNLIFAVLKSNIDRGEHDIRPKVKRPKQLKVENRKTDQLHHFWLTIRPCIQDHIITTSVYWPPLLFPVFSRYRNWVRHRPKMWDGCWNYIPICSGSEVTALWQSRPTTRHKI